MDIEEQTDKIDAKQAIVYEFMNKFADVLNQYEASMKIEDGKIVFASERFGKVTM